MFPLGAFDWKWLKIERLVHYFLGLHGKHERPAPEFLFLRRHKSPVAPALKATQRNLFISTREFTYETK